LSSCKHYGSIDQLPKIKTTAGDFNQGELFSYFDKDKMYSGLIDKYQEFGKGKAICFNVNVAHSVKTTQLFRDNGISAEHVDGATPLHERQRIFRDFARGEFKVLNNCGVATTGYDEPSIETVIVNRATMSLPLWLQMTGRGSRLYGDNTFNVLDMGSNCARHGLWNQRREWTLEVPKRKKSAGASPVKLCKSCQAMLHASASSCEYCGYVFPIKERELSESEFTQLDEPRRRPMPRKAIEDMTFQELHDYAKAKGYKPGWAYVQHKRRKK